jgi:cytochrome c peroxidase
MARDSAADRGTPDAGERARSIVTLALLAAAMGIAFGCAYEDAPAGGVNAHPVRLARPAAKPLSYVAQLGRDLFFDTRLSSSAKSACATCHAPDRAYGAAANEDTAARAVPSLRYLDRVPRFHIGPDIGDVDDLPAPPSAPAGAASRRTEKRAGAAAAPSALTPRGGLFWDGRETTLQAQAMVPLFNPSEMANRSAASLAARVRNLYGARLAKLFGAETIAPDDRLLAEATFAITRFELEDSTFHPYDSKYDAYLEGRARLTAEEARGLAQFDDPDKGNCAACHLDKPGVDGAPPAFSDFEYEALGVPRNGRTASRDTAASDLGLCGPIRRDLAAAKQYCGMFRTPSLRNVATRSVFFHNGAARTLDEVLRFYAFRDTRPDQIYPRRPDGTVTKFDDLPPQYRHNIDTTDAPFDRKLGQPPALTAREMADIAAFLRTLTDGHRPIDRSDRHSERAARATPE